ncbi:transposase [Bradyrhizobium pachyrhizi]|uniref:transposase n=1 Tax=Bradyrhizobium pachyrhizi TaxID=280333 RepID=UPI000AC41AEC|nr:transposase [Bradyrhizobium pachyrhizi]
MEIAKWVRPVLTGWVRSRHLRTVCRIRFPAFLLLERGRFLWPSPADGAITISPAQLGYLLSGIDWRNPQET